MTPCGLKDVRTGVDEGFLVGGSEMGMVARV